MTTQITEHEPPTCPRCGEPALWHATYKMWICNSYGCTPSARVFLTDQT